MEKTRKPHKTPKPKNHNFYERKPKNRTKNWPNPQNRKSLRPPLMKMTLICMKMNIKSFPLRLVLKLRHKSLIPVLSCSREFLSIRIGIEAMTLLLLLLFLPPAGRVLRTFRSYFRGNIQPTDLIDPMQMFSMYS